MIIKEFKDLYGYKFPKFYITEMWKYHDTHRFYIYDDGLNVPVFHILPDDNYVDICVCLFEPRYYQYDHERYLYNMPAEELNEFLKQPCEKAYKGKYTNWEALVKCWEENYDYDPKYDKITKQPDYTTIENNPIKRRSLTRWLKAKWYA